MAHAPTLSALDEYLRLDSIHAVYQPIVDLAKGEIVAYEALARGPSGSTLERPDLLFEAAREEGRLLDVEWACRSAALQGAVAARLAHPLTLFVNVEPETLVSSWLPERYGMLAAQAHGSFRIILEITERAVMKNPSELLAAVDSMRRLGIGIALDDVGVDASSLAMLPFLRPDVIKLDRSLIQAGLDPAAAQVVNAVAAETERTGATLLAEGIETEAHFETALALGAELGQGWRFGRPDVLPSPMATPRPGLAVRALTPIVIPPVLTPFDILQASRPIRRGNKRVLLAMSRQLEEEALRSRNKAIVLGAFQDERFFTERTGERYSKLAGEGAFVGALGVGLLEHPLPGVRGASLDLSDRLRGEWVVAVVDTHFSAAFAARDLGDEESDMDRTFDFAFTYDRGSVAHIAKNLLSRIVRENVGA